MILRDVVQEFISADSPIALRGKSQELDFIHGLYSHIDSARSFGGLRPVTDGKAVMWTLKGGIHQLLQDCKKESDPEHLFNLFKREEANMDIVMEKDAKIAKLEQSVESLSKLLASLDNP